MHIVNMTKFVIGLVFFAVGLAVLWQAKGTRGFGQKRQAGALFLIASGVFVAIGLGYLNIHGLFD